VPEGWFSVASVTALFDIDADHQVYAFGSRVYDSPDLPLLGSYGGITLQHCVERNADGQCVFWMGDSCLATDTARLPNVDDFTINPYTLAEARLRSTFICLLSGEQVVADVSWAAAARLYVFGGQGGQFVQRFRTTNASGTIQIGATIHQFGPTPQPDGYVTSLFRGIG
jgi:hypothetical protein